MEGYINAFSGEGDIVMKELMERLKTLDKEKLHSTNFEGMELIRPLYLIREEDICKWRDYNDLHFLQCACHFTETCSTCHEDGTTSSKRLETKKLIAKLKETSPFIEGNIFKSVENVNLSTVIAYKKDGVRHHFLDEY